MALDQTDYLTRSVIFERAADELSRHLYAAASWPLQRASNILSAVERVDAVLQGVSSIRLSDQDLETLDLDYPVFVSLYAGKMHSDLFRHELQNARYSMTRGGIFVPKTINALSDISKEYDHYRELLNF